MIGAAVEQLSVFPVWGQVAVILGLSIVSAKAIELVGYFVLKRSRQLTAAGYDRIIVEEIHVPLYATAFLAGIYFSAQLLERVTVGFYVANAAGSAIVVVWAYAVVRTAHRAISASNDTPSGRNVAPIFKNLLTFFVVLATFAVLLGVWEVDATPLLASAGVIGIVIGIAARDSLGNFFAGISMYLDRTYKLGDVIQLESGERGTVVDMSIRSTTILTRDNIEIAIPNGEMNSTHVINESAPVRRRRIRLDVGVAYGSDLETVQTALLEVADEETLVLEYPSPSVRFQEFGDSSIVAQLQCHIEHPALRGRAQHALIDRIDERFREEEVKIPFPQREVTFFESGNAISVEDGRRDVGSSPPRGEPDRIGDEPGKTDGLHGGDAGDRERFDRPRRGQGAGHHGEREPGAGEERDAVKDDRPLDDATDGNR